MRNRAIVWLALWISGMGIGAVRADQQDHRVQEPQLAPPERGSIAGSYASMTVRAQELSRGSFSLPGPFTVPEDRGPLLVEVLPSYAPDAGLDVFGLGWRNALRITRHREVGGVDFTDADLFATPWGVAVRGTDGRFHVRGASAPVVIAREGASLVALDANATRHRFVADDVTPEGTYSWRLVEVTAAEGDRTELEWENNASGRSFVREVRWGGRGIEQLAYRLLLVYEPIAAPIVDWRSGEPRTLDRRVARATLEAFQIEIGAFAPRWTYELSYVERTAAFFLASVTRRFASGEVEPAHTFEYELADDGFSSATLHRVPALDAYLRSVGSEGVQPSAASFFDVDLDGRMDLEHHYGQTLVQHTDAGYVYRALPRTGAEDARCRPRPSWNNEPRHLVRMRPVQEDAHHVLVTEPTSAFGGTTLVICDRPGFVLHEVALEGTWTLGANVRVVDVDADRDPDFVSVFAGGLQVLRNVSDAEGFAFEEEEPTAIALPYEPSASWLHDMNGDGLVDLVTRHTSGLDVWFGRGRGRFAEEALSLGFVGTAGMVIGDLDTHQIVFTDANQDGLEDAMLVRPGAIHLYTNRGTHFGLVDVPGLAEVRWDAGLPVAVDLEGRGEEQAVFVDGRTAHALTLSTPGSNLLAAASDGRGGRVSFTYRRSRPTPGIARRPPMLESMRVEGTGLDALTTRYDYDDATFHSESLHLLGFGTVRLDTSETIEVARFEHDDESGALVEARGADARRPGIWQLDAHAYETVSPVGVSRTRLVASRREHVGDDGTRLRGTSTAFSAFEGACPTRERHDTPHGSFEITRTLARPSGLVGAPHCLVAHERVRATHPGRATLDFTSSTAIERDASGRPLALVSEGDGLPLVTQRATYDASGRLTELRSPAGGVQRFEWDAGRLHAVTEPDGVRRVATRDPRTDAMASLSIVRGGESFDSWFRYDGFERLASRGSNVDGSTLARPAETTSYAFAGEGRPGAITVRTLVDASAGAYRELAELQTSSGEVIATATRTDVGFAFGAIDVSERSDGRVDTFARAPLVTDEDASTITMASLLDQSSLALRGRRWTSPHGDQRASEQTVNAGVVRHESSTRALTSEGIVTRTTVAGAYVSTTVRDADGRVRSTTDPSGATTTRAYDALGRLVAVTLPDGATQTVRYDAHGRVRAVEHAGVGAIASSFDPTRGVLVGKTFFGASGSAERQVRYEHDAIGRVIAERHVQLATGAERRFDFGYDGVGSGDARGQLGFRTSTRTAGFSRERHHRVDGLVEREQVDLDGWRRLELRHRYAADGSLRGATRIVRDASGRELVRVERELQHDALGRPHRVSLNGAPLATLHYDADGRVDRVELPNDAELVFEHDPITREQVGYTYATRDWTVTYGTQRDARGHVAVERVEHAIGEGALQSADRQHVRDERGFVVESSSEGASTTYAYGADGLPSRTNDLAGARDFVRQGDALLADDVTYRFDAEGRVIARDDATFAYGPDGQLERAFVDGRVLSYLHDDAGQRVLKRVDGRPTVGFVDGAVITESSFVEPIRVAGLVVGVIENGRFRAIATDARGTVLVDGAYRASTPFGVRESRGDASIAIDYAAKGWDEDLGVVRMGVRDYDPYLARFWSPDPLFAQDLERCAQSPTECALYGYVGNDPVEFVDPEGTEREAINRIRADRFRQREAQLKAGNAGAAMGLFNDVRTLAQLDDAMDSGFLLRVMTNLFRPDTRGIAFLFARDGEAFEPAIGHYASNAFVIVGHGGPGSFALKGAGFGGEDHWIGLSADQVVDLAEEEGFDAKRDAIFLYSCNGAVAPAGGKSFAQQLADASGVPVIAATDFVWHGSGGVSAGRYINGTNGGGPLDTSGTFVPAAWLVFMPTPKGP